MTIALDRRGFLGALGAAGALAACAHQPTTTAGKLSAVKGLPQAAPASVGLSADLTASIDAMMAAHIAADRITGGVTAVARRNKLVHFSAHGMFDRENNVPMRPDALFRMMSSTKPVTGVALLQQIETGAVSLDDPISKFVPSLKQMTVWKPEARAARRAGGLAAMRAPAKPDEVVPANRELTIKDFATHTSGLNSQGSLAPGESLAQYVPRLNSVPLDFQPGTRWAYSATTGPDVLARVVEITSKLPYDRYLSERIFRPIGMTDTAHNLTDPQMRRRVPRYAKPRNAAAGSNTAWTIADPPSEPKDTTFFAGSYGLSSTAHDYLLFESMLLNKGLARSGARVLKPESVALMSSNLVGDLYKGIGDRTQGTGFGILVRTVLDPTTCGCSRSAGGFGWGGAYGTMSWTDPKEELVAVIMIQQSVDQVQRDFEVVIRKAILS